LGNGSRRRGLAPRASLSGKAKNLERVSGSEDGVAKASTKNTLKADDQRQRRRFTATEKTRVENATSGGTGEPEPWWNAKTRRRKETEEGSDRRVDLKRPPGGTHRFAEKGLEVEGARRGSRVTGER